MDSVEIARLLTGMTLAVHIIFATIGVGMPLMFVIAEFIGIKKNDANYITLAKRWSKGYTITVAVGVVTGTIIGLQLSLVWPTFENGRSCYRFTTIHGNFCILLKQSFKYLFIYLGKI